MDRPKKTTDPKRHFTFANKCDVGPNDDTPRSRFSRDCSNWEAIGVPESGRFVGTKPLQPHNDGKIHANEYHGLVLQSAGYADCWQYALLHGMYLADHYEQCRKVVPVASPF